MSGLYRISGKGRLTPAKTVAFTFDGKSYEGLEGDTLASALLANGVVLTARSFKYHRPRGTMTEGSEEPNSLIGVRRDTARQQPNVRATMQEVYDGFNAVSQNRWPSLAFDIGAVNSILSPLFVAGFYYKTFMWPRAAWEKIYEPNIRAAAGLGLSPTEQDPDHYANKFAYADVVIIGGGPAGLTAALSAAKQGVSVIICDENAEFGGALLYESDVQIDGKSGYDWAQDALAQLGAMDNVTILPRTTAFGYYAQNMIGLCERITDHIPAPEADSPRERLWQIRAKKVIIAQGAIERHLVFANNDRPGIMMASAVRSYLNKYGVAVGSKIGVYTACDSAYAAAFDLKEAGVDIPIIVDSRSDVDPALLERARELGLTVQTGHSVIDTTGKLRISGIKVAKNGQTANTKYDVDALLISGGWTPSLHLYSQSRAKPSWDGDVKRFLPENPVQDQVSVGACNGTNDLTELLSEAQDAALNAAKSIGVKKLKKVSAPKEVVTTYGHEGDHIGSSHGAGADDQVKAFVDYQHDVVANDIRLAVREGMRSIEHVKRFTTTGMATDQGKTSNLHGLAIAADGLGKEIPQVGLTTFRSPFTPVSFGTIVNHGAGDLFDPVRRTPMHNWAVEQGAVFEDVGQWKRGWYFPKAGEDMHASVNRECKTVRESAGVFDASTLGKIEVVGPDAAKFLDIIYTNAWSTLKVGRCRYGIMTHEDGFIFDDGVVGRLAEDRFHVTTTTGGAAGVLNHMEDYLQTEFPELDVWLTSISEQWGVIGVQGPKARDIIAPLVEGIDLSTENMPHMSVREGRICGVPTRLFRMSFTGEMGYEINVPADYAESVLEAVWAEAQKHNACAYGTEAMHVLRAEKGYIIVGQETDGSITPHDAGLSWAVSKKKTDFVGIRGLMRDDLVAEGRKQLVGLKTKDAKVVLEEGAQIVADPNQPIPMKMLGHVTSSYWSENCGHSIALAIVEGGRSKMGDTLYVPMIDRTIEVEVVDTVFVDKDGGRLNG
ncbi:MAG: sarcosine oxidase subunit alpha [Lentilitoribacter sp.]